MNAKNTELEQIMSVLGVRDVTDYLCSVGPLIFYLQILYFIKRLQRKLPGLTFLLSQ